MTNTSRIEIPAEFLAASREQQSEFIEELCRVMAQRAGVAADACANAQSKHERLAAHHAAPVNGKSLDEARDELLKKFHSEALNEKIRRQ